MNENQTGVILEEVRDMFKVLAEGQQIMQKDIQDLKVGQHRLETKVDKLEIKVDQLEVKVDKLEVKVDRLEKDVKIIKSFVVAIDDGMNDHERRITTLEKKTANL